MITFNNIIFSAARDTLRNNFIYLRQLDRKTQVILFAFIVLLAVGHSGMTKVGDDIYYTDVDASSFAFIVHRYMAWTSRILIEIMLQPMAKLPIAVFMCVNTLLVFALPFLLARLLASRAEMQKLLFPAICFVVMYPFFHMRSAGWIATCINYLWPLVAALLAVMPFRKLYDGIAVSTSQYVFSILCFAFACNNELLCLLFLIIIPVYAIFLWKTFPKKILILYTAVALASLSFALLSPGNMYRLEIEIVNWMPDFPTLSIFYKLYQGYMSMVIPFFLIQIMYLLALPVCCALVFFTKQLPCRFVFPRYFPFCSISLTAAPMFRATL